MKRLAGASKNEKFHGAQVHGFACFSLTVILSETWGTTGLCSTEIGEVVMNAFEGCVIESSSQRTAWDKMEARSLKTIGSKISSFYVDNFFFVPT